MSKRGSLATFERSPWPRLQLRAEGESAVPRAFSLGNMAAMVAAPQAAMPHAASMSSVISLELTAAALMAPPPPPPAAAAASAALSGAARVHDETLRVHDETDETLLESMRGHHPRPSEVIIGHHPRPSEVIRADAASMSAMHTRTDHAPDALSPDALSPDSISPDEPMTDVDDARVGAVLGAHADTAPASPRFVRDSSEAAASSPRFVNETPSYAEIAPLRFVNETPSYAEAMEMPATTPKLPTAVKGHQWPSMAMPATMPPPPKTAPSSAVVGGASADLGARDARCVWGSPHTVTSCSGRRAQDSAEAACPASTSALGSPARDGAPTTALTRSVFSSTTLDEPAPGVNHGVNHGVNPGEDTQRRCPLSSGELRPELELSSGELRPELADGLALQQERRVERLARMMQAAKRRGVLASVEFGASLRSASPSTSTELLPQR